MRPGVYQARQGIVPGAQAWKQPREISGQKVENMEEADERLQRVVSEMTEVVGEGNALKLLGLTVNGEHVLQHAFVSGLLALEVLVTGSLPSAMITQVGSASMLCCKVPEHTLKAHITDNALLAIVCHIIWHL